MGWNGSGQFTRDNGTNTGSDVWTKDKNASTKILASLHDVHDENIATGLENCVTRDGQNTPSNDLPMATFKHTGVGNAATTNQYASASQVLYSTLLYGGTSSGGANQYTLTMSIAPTAATAGLRLQFKSHQLNTGASTITAGSISAVAIQRPDGSALTGSEIPSGAYVTVVFNGSVAILDTVTPIWTTFAAGSSATGPMTFGTLTVDYSRYRRDITGRVFIEISVSGTTGGTASASLTFNLPIAPTTAGTILQAGTIDGGYGRGYGVWTSGFTVTVLKDSGNWGLGAGRGFLIQDSYLAP